MSSRPLGDGERDPVEWAQHRALVAISVARTVLDLAEAAVADRERLERLATSGRSFAETWLGDAVRLASTMASGFGFDAGTSPTAAPPGPPPARPAPPAASPPARPAPPAAKSRPAAKAVKAPAKKAANKAAKKAANARKASPARAKPGTR